MTSLRFLALLAFHVLPVTAGGPIDREPPIIPVLPAPALQCSRRPKLMTLDGYVDAAGNPVLQINMGICEGRCRTTSLTGPKRCNATRVDIVTVYNKYKNYLPKDVPVVRECGCVCAQQQPCHDGYHWVPEYCKCVRDMDYPPCQVAPLLSSALQMWVDIGRCRGFCDGDRPLCRPLIYSQDQLVDPTGVPSPFLHLERCGCSDCAVHSQYITVTFENGATKDINVGQCTGTCVPDNLAAELGTSPLVPTTCLAVATQTLPVTATLNLTQILRCDCRPKCKRVPQWVALPSPTGDTKVDIGACVGECAADGGSCGPTLQEPLDCAGTVCPTVNVTVECGCAAAGTPGQP